MIAIGTDIVRIARIAGVLDRQGERFVSRILRPEEIHEYQAHREPARLLAKRFAAKEAVAKCLGTGIGRGVSWQDILIHHDNNGAPLVTLSGGAREVAQRLGSETVLISLSDEDAYVVDFAALQ